MRHGGRATARPSARGGFTLLELLIVIAIIGVLATLSIRVVFGLLSMARKARTQVVLMTIDGLLKTRMQAFDRYFDEQTKSAAKQRQLVNSRDEWVASSSSGRPSYLPANTTYFVMAGGQNIRPNVPANDDKRALQRALVMARKGLFRRYFPQTWAEVRAWKLDSEVGVTPPTSPNPVTESAEVLYFVLTKATLPGYTQEGDDQITTTDARDTDGNGFLEFVDGWGQPIRYYRWPTRLVRDTGPGIVGNYNTTLVQTVMGGVPSRNSFRRDPEDPTLRIGDVAIGNDLWQLRGLSGGPHFLKSEDYEALFMTPSTASVPLLLSVGADGLSAIPEYKSTAATTSAEKLARLAQASLTVDDSFDDISNLNTRAGVSR